MEESEKSNIFSIRKIRFNESIRFNRNHLLCAFYYIRLDSDSQRRSRKRNKSTATKSIKEFFRWSRWPNRYRMPKRTFFFLSWGILHPVAVSWLHLRFSWCSKCSPPHKIVAHFSWPVPSPSSMMRCGGGRRRFFFFLFIFWSFEKQTYHILNLMYATTTTIKLSKRANVCVCMAKFIILWFYYCCYCFQCSPFPPLVCDPCHSLVYTRAITSVTWPDQSISCAWKGMREWEIFRHPSSTTSSTLKFVSREWFFSFPLRPIDWWFLSSLCCVDYIDVYWEMTERRSFSFRYRPKLVRKCVFCAIFFFSFASSTHSVYCLSINFSSTYTVHTHAAHTQFTLVTQQK